MNIKLSQASNRWFLLVLLYFILTISALYLVINNQGTILIWWPTSIVFVIVTVTALSLVMVVSGRKQAERKLQEINDHLEQLVTERTKALTREISERKKVENALRDSEERYRNIIENSVDGIMLIDDDGYILEWNRGLEEITGLKKSEALGKKYDEIIFKAAPVQRKPSKPSEFYQAYLDELFQSDTPVFKRTSKINFVHSDGAYRTIQLVFFLVETRKKALLGAIIRDITEQEQFADAIYSYAQRLQILHDIDHAILESKSLDHLINTLLPNLRRLVSAQWVNIVTYDKEMNISYLGIDIDPQINKESVIRFDNDREQIPPLLKQRKFLLIDDLQSFPEITPVLKPLQTGGIRTFLSVPLLLRDEFIGVILLGAVKPNAFGHEQIDIAREVANEVAIAIQQTRLLGQIWARREELRQLAQRVVNAQEEERRRLSRELHDEAGQALTALKISLELIAGDLPVEMGSFRQRLVEAISLTDDTMEQIRLLARGLRPPALDTFGLNFALEDLCREFARRSKITVEYQGKNLPPVTEEINICFYRILQESLTNIYKHAQADHIMVELQCENGSICLTVSDDGKGFKKGKALNNKKGLGLLGIKERLEMLGGRLEIKSTSGQGSILTACIPWTDNNKDIHRIFHVCRNN